jgi:hypothetical protein
MVIHLLSSELWYRGGNINVEKKGLFMRCIRD